MLTREDDIGVHALRRQGWTISAIVRHLAGLPQFVGRLGLGRECFRSSGAWRVGWNPISCRHTICGVSLDRAGFGRLGCGHVLVGDAAGQPGWVGGVVSAAGAQRAASGTGSSVAKVIHNFGRAEQVDRDALARLVSSISRFLTPEQATAAVRRTAGSRPVAAWMELGVPWVDAIDIKG